MYSASAGQVGNPSDGGIAGGAVGINYAFIQFAGFTMGRTLSAFDTPWVNYPANNFDGLVGGSGSTNGVNQFTYTAQFGNGVSGILSAQDRWRPPSGVMNLTGASASGMLGGTNGLNNIAGTRAPDLIGVLKVDQAWGVLQLSAVAHNNHAAYYGGTETTGHPDDKWGWAVQGALQVKNHADRRRRRDQCQPCTRMVPPGITCRAWPRSATRCSAAPTCLVLTRASALPTLLTLCTRAHRAQTAPG